MFEIIPADYKEFARFSAFYRHDGFFREGYGELFNLFCPGTPCCWVLLDGVRVGGAVAGEGLLSNVFAIPPFTDRPALLKHLTRHVMGLSRERVYAHNVLVSEMEDFFALGYRQVAELRHLGGQAPDYAFGFMRSMARPTQAMEAAPPEGMEARRLTLKDTKRAAALLMRAYAGGDPQRPDIKEFVSDTDMALRTADPCCREASCAVWRDGRMVGVCVITRWEGWPLVFDIATDPDVRGGRIGAFMLRRALDALHKRGEAALKLFVELGNPAETLYRSMGFVGGEASASMFLDV